ncbi:F-box protein At4g18380-like [Bidens hawaiensis]|uniref:F-box protein At4g18380-like n=1 Tax=Bidens hawaiensis TaxID=980011 RepID=UPI00404A7EDD
MKPTEGEGEEDASSLNRLPDELILQILTKQTDLKTLCFCHLVSKRFANIVLQLHTISFTAPLLNPPPKSGTNTSFWSILNGVVFKPIHLLRRMVLPSSRPLPPIISSFYGDSFRSAVSFLIKFREAKSLSIELPSSTHKGVNNSSLFKWKVSLATRIESFVFLSPNSISDTNGLYVDDVNYENIEQEQDLDLTNFSTDSFKRKVHIAFQCLKDVIVRHRMLLYFIKELPNLENLVIMDSGKRGTVGMSAGKLAEVRGWVHSAPGNVKPEMNRIEVPVNVSQCYVPVLEMAVSGCVMKGVTCVVMRMNDAQDGDDCFVDGDNRFEDKVEAAYSEAVMEILEKHKDKMKRLL